MLALQIVNTVLTGLLLSALTGVGVSVWVQQRRTRKNRSEATGKAVAGIAAAIVQAAAAKKQQRPDNVSPIKDSA